jgi:branched-chain amino acid transport system ATP-binding protein
VAEVVLETAALSRHFGGVTALDGVSLAIERGAVHAIVGPNGAGKTTLINVLSGALAPSSGRVRFRGRDVTGWPVHRVARLGVGRSFQQTNVFRAFSCLENCFLAAQTRRSSAMRLVRPASRDRASAAEAEEALALVGLADRRDVAAAQLSHGEQRQLELAMMLATGPELLLLDEPLAGCGREESGRIVELLRRLAGPRTLLMIEHDMDAVFSIARTVTVMVDGRELETGPPERIRASAAVRDAYLGARR